MNKKESEQDDVRKYLEVDELIRLSDLELMLLRTTSKNTFDKLEFLIKRYYHIADLRRKINELNELTKNKEENRNDS